MSRIPPDSESGGIRLSLVIVDSHLLTGAPLADWATRSNFGVEYDFRNNSKTAACRSLCCLSASQLVNEIVV